MVGCWTPPKDTADAHPRKTNNRVPRNSARTALQNTHVVSSLSVNNGKSCFFPKRISASLSDTCRVSPSILGTHSAPYLVRACVMLYRLQYTEYSTRDSVWYTRVITGCNSVQTPRLALIECRLNDFIARMPYVESPLKILSLAEIDWIARQLIL